MSRWKSIECEGCGKPHEVDIDSAHNRICPHYGRGVEPVPWAFPILHTKKPSYRRWSRCNPTSETWKA